MTEADVSIIIPTYKRRTMLPKAMKSALASGAGEIIVIDNKSEDGTAEYIRSISDPRVRLLIQPQNVGIWKNHRDGIAAATKKWIKFVHADDFLGENGLAAFCAATDDFTALVWANPIFFDHDTGSEVCLYALDAPLRFSSVEYCRRLEHTAWELGTPSHVMFRRDTVDLSEQVWENAQYSDVICALRAVRAGNVVLLPEGPINHGLHSDQISRTQGLETHFERNFNTLAVMLADNDPWIRSYGALFGWAETFVGLRSLAGWLLQNRRLPSADVWRWQGRILSMLPMRFLVRHPLKVFDMVKARYCRRPVRLART